MSEHGGCRGKLMGRGGREASRCGDVLHVGPGSDYTEGATVKRCTVNVYALFFRLQLKKFRENLVGNPKAVATTPCQRWVRLVSYPLPWRVSDVGREAERCPGLGNQAAGLSANSPCRHIKGQDSLPSVRLPSHWGPSFQILLPPGCEGGSFIFPSLWPFMLIPPPSGPPLL